MVPLPRYADTVVVGGGTAGPVLAACLSRQPGHTVVVIEAGPDYGGFAGGAWPADLLDPYQSPISHDWGYTSASISGQPGQSLARARVVGGCSAHNGCAAVWGSRVDYDGWELLGNEGWSADELRPIFLQVSAQMGLCRLPVEQLPPWHQASLATALGLGIPWVDDLNDLDQDLGIGVAPVNIVRDVRWNAAFAYLDPARARPQLAVVDQTLVGRLRLGRGRATGVEVFGPDGRASIEAGQVVLCAGSYGSPSILLRSGIGPADELRNLGIEPAQDLRGVGRNLHDHPAIYLAYGGTPALEAMLADYLVRNGKMYVLPLIAKLRSSQCATAFDLHLFPMCWPQADSTGQQTGWQWVLAVANMAPRSRGRLQLVSSDPAVLPRVDTCFLSDPEDVDATIMMDGIEIAREWARHGALGALSGQELDVTAQAISRDALRRICAHYFHPVGTCRMGPAADPESVVDRHGRVHGWDNLYVADASIMPVIPRANTNLPTLVVAQRIADWLLGGLSHSGVQTQVI
jgi:choline dehydrogenase